MSSQLRLVQSPPKTYADGYIDGFVDGERKANTRYVWRGLIGGILASALLVWLIS